MRSKNRVLKLVANKLANEATEEELRELDHLLTNNSQMREQVKLLSEWWHDEQGHDQERTVRIFEKIRRRIDNSD